MRTREVVERLAHHAFEQSELPHAQQQRAVVADRSQLDELLAAKGDGPVAMAAKLARLSDKVVARTVELGGSSAAAESYLHRLGIVRQIAPGLASTPASTVPPALPPTLIEAKTAPSAATAAPTAPEAAKPATHLSPGAHLYTFRSQDGAVVGIDRVAVDTAGSTMLTALLHGPMADPPDADGHWPMLRLTGLQLELVKSFCEGKLVPGKLSPDHLEAASIAGDYLGLESLELAVDSEMTRRPWKPLLSQDFVEKLSRGVGAAGRWLAEEFVDSLERAVTSPTESGDYKVVVKIEMPVPPYFGNEVKHLKEVRLDYLVVGRRVLNELTTFGARHLIGTNMFFALGQQDIFIHKWTRPESSVISCEGTLSFRAPRTE